MPVIDLEQEVASRRDAFPLRLRTVGGMDASGAEELEELVGPSHRIAARRDLLEEGTATKSVAILQDGWACRHRATADGKRQITMVLLPGDVCNPDAVIWNRAGYGVRALTRCTVAYMDAGDLRSLVRDSPTAGPGWMTLSFIDSAMLAERAVLLGGRSALGRLAHFFCEVYVRLVSVGRASDMAFELPMTQEEIGDAIGLTAVHVNRVLRVMRADGLVAAAGRRVTLLDWRSLARIAEFDPAYLRIAAMRPIGRRGEGGRERQAKAAA